MQYPVGQKYEKLLEIYGVQNVCLAIQTFVLVEPITSKSGLKNLLHLLEERLRNW